MHRVSAAIIVFNEEHTIERCLNSLLWVDEIVVVDAYSTDNTKKIACDPNAPWAKKLKWHERLWSGFRDQRNFCISQTTNDWILVVDADEKCTDVLKSKIQEILKQTSPHTAWKVRRQEYFLGKPIYFGIWNPSYQDRFFHKSGVHYINDIHEYPYYPVKPMRIHEPLEHYPDFEPEKFLTKMNKYTTIEARDRVKAGKRTNLFRVIFAGPAMFIKNYFYYKAYRDGAHGIVISVLEGVSRSVRHVKMWQIQNNLKRGNS